MSQPINGGCPKTGRGPQRKERITADAEWQYQTARQLRLSTRGHPFRLRQPTQLRSPSLGHRLPEQAPSARRQRTENKGYLPIGTLWLICRRAVDLVQPDLEQRLGRALFSSGCIRSLWLVVLLTLHMNPRLDQHLVSAIPLLAVSRLFPATEPCCVRH